MRDGTPLHAAKTAEEAAGLIARGASVHARGSRDDTPLHRAANAAVAEVLIAAGANVDARAVLGRTPLHWASQAGRAEVIAVLLRAGAEVGMVDEHGRTPLHDASWSGSRDAVALLLGAGADPHRRSLGGETPLHTAKGAHRAEVAEALRLAMAATPAPARAESHPRGLLRIGVHPRRREAITVGHDATLTRWSLEDEPRPVATLQLTLARINDLAIAPDGEVFAIATSGETVELRRRDDLSLSGEIATGGVQGAEASALAFSPDGRWLAVADGVERIVLIDRATGLLAGSTEAAPGVPSLVFDPASGLLASTHADQGGGFVSIERVEPEGGLTFLETFEDEHDGPAITWPARIAFRPDGRLLAVFSDRTREAAFMVFELDGGHRPWCWTFDVRKPRDRRAGLDASGRSWGVAFADDRTVAFGTPRGIVLFFDAETGRRVGRVRIDPGAPVIDLAKDPDRPILWAALGSGPGLPVRVPLPIGGR